MTTRKSPLEDVESTIFTSWLRGNNLLNGHVPNETPTGTKVLNPDGSHYWKKGHRRNMRNHAVGVTKGMPDHFIIVRADQCVYGRTIGLVVEMKREDGVPSDFSPEQLEWLEAFSEICDVESFGAYGAKEAIAFVSPFIINPKKYDW